MVLIPTTTAIRWQISVATYMALWVSKGLISRWNFACSSRLPVLCHCACWLEALFDCFRTNLISHAVMSTLFALQNVQLLREKEGLVLKIDVNSSWRFIQVKCLTITAKCILATLFFSYFFGLGRLSWCWETLIVLKVRDIYSEKGMTLYFFCYYIH